MRTVPDARNMREWLDRDTDRSVGNSYTGVDTVSKPKRAVVVGGGFIGLEMVENLVHRGLEVTLIEKLNQVMPPLDPEMARLVERYMAKRGIQVELNDGVAGFRQLEDGTLEVLTESKKAHPAHIVILAIGVRPETALAKMAGLEIGECGGFRVDRADADFQPRYLRRRRCGRSQGFRYRPMDAHPAGRTGEPAGADRGGRDCRSRFPSIAVLRALRSASSLSGDMPRPVQVKSFSPRLGETDFEKIYLYPNSHAGYYPGAKILSTKVLFRKSDGRLLGAQDLGEDGVPKRIDSFAMAIQMGCTVYDLEEAELCYAPPYGSAKDPVNFAGMVAADVLRDDMPLCHWNSLDGGFLLDVRNPPELDVESCPGALNIPLPELRGGWANFHATARSSLCAAPRSGPTTRRESFCRMASSPQHLRRHAGTFTSCRGLK